jgi:hypothetical protein
MARFDDVPSKTQPLRCDTSKGDIRLRPLTVLQEQSVSLAAVNSEPELYPVGPDGVSDQFKRFAPIYDPFGNVSDRVYGITNITKASGKTIWFAVVRPSSGNDQIWSSIDKSVWSQVPITFIDPLAPFQITSINSYNGIVVVTAGQTYLLGDTTAFIEYQDDYGIDSDGLIGSSKYVDSSGVKWGFATTGTNIVLTGFSSGWDTYETPEQFSSIILDNAKTNTAGDVGAVGVTNNSIYSNHLLGTSQWQLQLQDSDLQIIKIKRVSDVQIVIGHDNSTDEPVLYWSTSDYNDSDSYAWFRATVLNGVGSRFTDIDYGNGQWMVSTSDPGGRMWYSEDKNPTRFYYGVSTILPTYKSDFIGYGGGLSYEWLSASKSTSTLAVSDAAPKYNGVLMPDSLGADTILVGEYTDTYYDSTGLQSTVEPLYQFIDDDIQWDAGKLLVGADSNGDLWEMDSVSSLELGSRLAAYKYLKDGAGTFQLVPTDDIDDDYHYWIKDIFVDTISDDSQVGYSIVRKDGDPTLTQRSDVITLQDYDLKELSEDRLNNIVGSMVAYANSELSIGKYLLLPEPTEPYDAPYNETGGWLKKGYALDTRKVSYGSSIDETVNTYWLWCKVTDDPLGAPYYTDSDYYVPEGIDSGYVYP